MLCETCCMNCHLSEWSGTWMLCELSVKWNKWSAMQHLSLDLFLSPSFLAWLLAATVCVCKKRSWHTLIHRHIFIHTPSLWTEFFLFFFSHTLALTHTPLTTISFCTDFRWVLKHRLPLSRDEFQQGRQREDVQALRDFWDWGVFSLVSCDFTSSSRLARVHSNTLAHACMHTRHLSMNCAFYFNYYYFLALALRQRK